MSNAEPMRVSSAAERQTFQGRQSYRRGGQPRLARAPFPPLVEQAVLFGFFVGGAAFWMAVIWWIVR